MRVALHTRLKPGCEQEYDQAHREVPRDLAAAMRRAGASRWTVWRSGLDIFQLIECQDYGQLLAELRDLPANVAWQARMAALQDVTHDYSTEGDQAEMPVVWDLEKAA